MPPPFILSPQPPFIFSPQPAFASPKPPPFFSPKLPFLSDEDTGGSPKQESF